MVFLRRNVVEYQKAKRVYLWLWLSPLLTLPTLSAILIWDLSEYLSFDYAIEERLTGISAVLGSALWHLVLLKSARNEDSFLVRWHARQALILAGLRTAVPFFFVLVFGFGSPTLFSVPILIFIWFFGTLIGQYQAKRGNCSLARLFGHADKLPGPPARSQEQTKEIEDLVELIRFSKNNNFRANALLRLKELGVVEDL